MVSIIGAGLGGLTLARIAAEFDGWAPKLTALIAEGTGSPVLRSIYQLPDRHRWAGYEEIMLPRCEAAAIAAHRTISTIYGDDAPDCIVNPFKGVLAPQQRHS